MLTRLSAGLLLAFLSLAPARIEAQCLTTHGACNAALSGIYCGTPPRIGLNWLVCARPSCGLQRNALFVGGCAAPPVQIPAPVACTNCSTNCLFGIHPVVFTQPWPGTFCFQFNIPNDQRLIGLRFCIQNVCLWTTPCVCLSNTMQVTVQN